MSDNSEVKRAEDHERSYLDGERERATMNDNNNTTKLDAQQIRCACAVAAADERTVRKYLRDPASVRSSVRSRIESAFLTISARETADAKARQARPSDAYRMRLDGAPFAVIARHMGCTTEQAYEHVAAGRVSRHRIEAMRIDRDRRIAEILSITDCREPQ